MGELSVSRHSGEGTENGNDDIGHLGRRESLPNQAVLNRQHDKITDGVDDDARQDRPGEVDEQGQDSAVGEEGVRRRVRHMRATDEPQRREAPKKERR